MLGVEELATVFFSASHNILSAHYCKLILDLYKDKDIPRDLESMTCLRGIGKKSALLVLKVALNLVLGIPTDRHVAFGAFALKWTPPNCGKKGNEFETSHHLELWVPPEKLHLVNDKLASVGQLLSHKKEFHATILMAAQQCGGSVLETAKILLGANPAVGSDIRDDLDNVLDTEAEEEALQDDTSTDVEEDEDDE